MHDNARRFRVGLLVIGATALFAGMIVFVIGASFGSRTHDYYVLFDENVKGMVVGSRVNFQGVPVGTVQDIRFQNGKTRVKIGVDPDLAEIQEVTRARLDRLLVTGQVTVELEGYEYGGKSLRDGSVIPPKDSPMNQLTSSLPVVVEHADLLLVRATSVLGKLEALLSEPNLRSISGLLANLDRTTAALPQQLDDTVRDLRRAVAAVGELAGDGEVHATLAAAQRALGRVEALGEEARALVAGNRRGVGEALAALRETLHEVRGLARALGLAPSSLLYGRQVDELRVEAAAPAGGRGGGR